MPNIVSDWSSRLLSLHHVAHLVCQFFLFETSTLQTGPPCPSQFRSASGVQINYSLKKKDETFDEYYRSYTPRLRKYSSGFRTPYSTTLNSQLVSTYCFNSIGLVNFTVLVLNIMTSIFFHISKHKKHLKQARAFGNLALTHFHKQVRRETCLLKTPLATLAMFSHMILM